MDSDEMEPLRWYHVLGLTALGIVAITVVGATALVGSYAFDDQHSVAELATGEAVTGSEIREIGVSTFAMFTDPAVLLSWTALAAFLLLFAAPYLEWKRRELLEGDHRERRQ